MAAGRVDGFWEMGLKPWDTAAGTLLITEAGGRVGTLIGEDYKQGGHIVGGHAKVFAALVAALAPHVTRRASRSLTSGRLLRAFRGALLRIGLTQKPYTK